MTAPPPPPSSSPSENDDARSSGARYPNWQPQGAPQPNWPRQNTDYPSSPYDPTRPSPHQQAYQPGYQQSQYPPYQQNYPPRQQQFPPQNFQHGSTPIRGYHPGPPGYYPQQPHYPYGQPRPYATRRRGLKRLNIVLGLVVLLAITGMVVSIVNPASLGALGDLIADSPVPVEPPTSTSANSPAVAPPPVAKPSDSYEFWHVDDYENGEPVPTRWSSCELIKYQINPNQGDEYFVDWVHATVDEVSLATGLDFSYEGLTYEELVLDSDFSSFDVFEDLPPVTIQFASEQQVPDLEGNIEGLAVLQQVENPLTGNTRFVGGEVFLDETLLTDRNINREPAYVHVLRHELAHIAGLGHVEDLRELMHEAPIVHDFGPGDLTGLAQLGGGPCE